MKVDKLHIRSRFKNLEDVLVDFAEDHLMTVVVGRNGSGKSNVLEALVSIFRNLDLGEPAPFSYELQYQLGEQDWVSWYEVKIDADPARGTPAKQYEVYVKNLHDDGKFHRVPLSKVRRDKKTKRAEYLPNFLFAYYSGPSDRLEKYFRKHRDNYYRELLYSKLDIREDIRSLFYAKPEHSQFVLMAFFLNPDLEEERQFLEEQLGIQGLDSIHFVLRRPPWEKDKNDRFWGADGVVRDFLELLYPHGLAPVKVSRIEDTSLTGKNRKNDFVHVFLPSVDCLHEIAKQLTPSIFFKMLESTVLSEIISEVHVRVKVTHSETPITFKELSEGEQQLLTVLGLLKFTGGKDSLFLLDEPDTHLNPSWASKYLKFLKRFVPNHETSHLLMVSHHPLAIAELDKQQVQVMWRDSSHQAYAREPEESPRGMGYSGILTSDMFGLLTTLDNSTERLLRLRRRFSEKEHLSGVQRGRLKKIDHAIEKLGFTTAHWDKEYSQYLRLKKEVEQEVSEQSKNPEFDKIRRQRAKEIVRKILASEESEEKS